ncbi:hypothetical protein [Aquimarina aggregata]|uniref:hypothetical protein n=1 Tax=Aquimarina aggregata TaxID=1642818 RepID=UPI00248F93C3|nr:hypothetical protein [Aquimarina aggregata]
MVNRSILLCSFIFLFQNCNFLQSENSRQLDSLNNELKELNNIYTNKELQLTSSLFNRIIKNKENAKHTLLVYYSADCSSCFEQLKRWEQTLLYFQGFGNNLNIKFILYTNDETIIEEELEKVNFPKSYVIYDHRNEFIKRYDHAAEYPYNTMLLDKDYKILFIGSPLDSESIKKHYTELISN